MCKMSFSKLLFTKTPKTRLEEGSQARMCGEYILELKIEIALNSPPETFRKTKFPNVSKRLR